VGRASLSSVLMIITDWAKNKRGKGSTQTVSGSVKDVVLDINLEKTE
jgi:hypothetical protein